MIPGAPENKRLQPVIIDREVIATQVKDALHHYKIISKLGFPQGVKCWCGTELNFTVHERGQQQKRKAFFDQHDECDAPKEIQN